MLPFMLSLMLVPAGGGRGALASPSAQHGSQSTGSTLYRGRTPQKSHPYIPAKTLPRGAGCELPPTPPPILCAPCCAQHATAHCCVAGVRSHDGAPVFDHSDAALLSPTPPMPPPATHHLPAYTGVSASMPGPSPLLTRSPISTAALVNRSMPSLQQQHQNGAPATPLPYSNGNSTNTSSNIHSGAAGRSPSAGRVTGSGNSLRAALHSATPAAADRNSRASAPDRNSQSPAADAVGSWRVGPGLSGSASPASVSQNIYGVSSSGGGGYGSSAGGGGYGAPNFHNKPPSVSSPSATAGLFSGGFPSSGGNSGSWEGPVQSQGPQQQQHHQFTAVARVLAPNGQPRKVPISMLGQYQAARAEAAAATADVLASNGGGGAGQGNSNGGRGATRSGSLSGGGMMLGMDPAAAKLKAVAALRYGLVSK